MKAEPLQNNTSRSPSPEAGRMLWMMVSKSIERSRRARLVAAFPSRVLQSLSARATKAFSILYLNHEPGYCIWEPTMHSTNFPKNVGPPRSLPILLFCFILNKSHLSHSHPSINFILSPLFIPWTQTISLHQPPNKIFLCMWFYVRIYDLNKNGLINWLMDGCIFSPVR